MNGAEGDRTPNLVIANDALSQLSYGPNILTKLIPGGFFCNLASSGRCRAVFLVGGSLLGVGVAVRLGGAVSLEQRFLLVARGRG